MEQLFSFFRNYLIPSGIVLAVITYLLNVLRQYKNNKEALRTKRLSLIDKLNTDSTKVNSLFESLRTNAELNGFFDFKNINTIKPMVARLQNISSDDLAIFEKDKLRTTIVEIGDFLSSLLVDVDSLENVAQMQVNEGKQAKNKFDTDIQKLRETVIPLGFQITPFNVVINPTGKASNKKYNSILSSVAEIKSAYDASMSNIAYMNQGVKDRRLFYCMKLLDAQNRLRNLTFLLDEAKEIYLKRNLLARALNKIAQ